MRYSTDSGEATYTYNPNGLRHSKEVDTDKRVHAWDGSNIIAETDGDVVLEFYYWAQYANTGLYLDLSDYSLPTASYMAGPTLQKARFEFSSSDPLMYGAALRFVSYSSYGSVYISDVVLYRKGDLGKRAGKLDDNPFRYCGEYWDFETNTYYLRARVYNPTIGRFLTEDPVRAGLNWYTYCVNNPVYYWDPTGRVPITRAVMLTDTGGGFREAFDTYSVLKHDRPTMAVTPDDKAYLSKENLALLEQYISEWNAAWYFREDSTDGMDRARAKMEILRDTYRGGGELAIFSANTSDGAHAWIQYTSSWGEVFSIGTFGNTGYGRQNIYFNRELNELIKDHDAFGIPETYTMSINKTQVNALFDYIRYVEGQNIKWDGDEHNCAYFAATAWEKVTGTKLAYMNTYEGYGYADTRVLSESIIDKYYDLPEYGYR